MQRRVSADNREFAHPKRKGTFDPDGVIHQREG
jgi:hypothetical protein